MFCLLQDAHPCAVGAASCCSMANIDARCSSFLFERCARWRKRDSFSVPSLHTQSTWQTRNNTVTLEGMHIDVLPPQGKIKYFGTNHHVHAEFDHRLKCAWAIFTCNWQELDNPLRERLMLFDVTLTPSLHYASGTCTSTEEIKREKSRQHHDGWWGLYTYEKKFRQTVPKLRTLLRSSKSLAMNHTTRTVNRRKTPPRTGYKTPTSKTKATNTPTTTPLATAYRKTS